MQFSAAITKDEMYQGEKAAQNWGPTRRLAMAALTRSSSDLEDLSAPAAEGIMEAAENLSKYLKWREHEAEMLEAALARMLVVIQAYSDKHPNHKAELEAQTGEAS